MRIAEMAQEGRRGKEVRDNKSFYADRFAACELIVNSRSVRELSSLFMI